MSPKALSGVDLNGQSASRRLIIIPLLFFLLVVGATAFTFVIMNTSVNESVQMEAVARLRSTRSRLMTEALLNANGQPRPYGETARQLKQLMSAVRYGGTVPRAIDGEQVRIPSPPAYVNTDTLAENSQLVDELITQTDKLARLSPESPAFGAQLALTENVIWRLKDANNNLVLEYIEANRNRANRLSWIAALLMSLLGGFGILLTLQQRRADRVLTEKEERLRQIFNNSPIGKVLASPDGSWIQVNTALCNLLGYTAEELTGKTFMEMTHPEDYEEEQPIRQRLINGEIETYQITKRYMHKNGHEIWTLANVAAVRGPDRTPRYLIIQLVDISEQRATLEALKASESKFRSVIESATDGVVVADESGHIISANSAANRMFGYPDQGLTGQEITLLIPERYKRRHQQAYARVFETGAPVLTRYGHPLEVEGRHHAGHEFPIEISVGIWRDSKGEMFVTSIIRDITERKQAEQERQELLRSNRDLEEFAIIASHDLQEPLRKISIFSERLVTRMNGNLDNQARDYVDRILSSTSRMKSLISDLLTYSRVTSKACPFEPVNLQQTVDDLVAEMDITSVGGHADVVIDPLPVIEADPSQMRQLFQNLLENAVKYRQDGASLRIHIHANVKNEPAAEDEVPQYEIRVQDNGIGFDEKYLDRIFKVFQRLHARNHYEGTGIGLATCRRIVERHHGSITATSTPGAGSTFIVTLPVKQPEKEGQMALS